MGTQTSQGTGSQHSISSAQTGTGASTHIVQLVPEVHKVRDAVGRQLVVKLVTTVGATPTMTMNIQGSFDGTTWFNLNFKDLNASLTTDVSVTPAITTATTRWYWVPASVPFTYFRVNYATNTNVTNTVDVWVY